jgi:S-adenosylmethionine hydrolase
VLVGPDNGLLPWAADALGGVNGAIELINRDWFAADVSRTFHGRDIFAPAAARIAAGADPADAGPAIDPDSLVRLPDPVVAMGDGWLEAEVTTIDRFGNVQLAAAAAALTGLGRALTVGGVRAVRGDTFSDAPPGGLVVFVDSADRVAIAVNGGRAAVVLAVTPGDVLRVTTN